MTFGFTRSKKHGAIRTEYNGRMFRSKLEADYARAFDALQVSYNYEKSGRYFGDVFYLPDFWLPHSRQIVEVKGVFEPSDCRKIHAVLTEIEPHAFAQHDVPIVACLPGGEFYGWARQEGAAIRVGTDAAWLDFLTKNAIAVDLLRCSACSQWWFAATDESWRCRCCGAYDGARHILDRVSSPLPSRTNEEGDQAFPDIDLLRAIGSGDSITALV